MRSASRLACALLASVLVGCASVPFDYPKDESLAVEPSPATNFGREAAEWSAAHDNKSGFLPLTSGMDALGARLHLIDMAEATIDAQYFLIKPDTAGALFARSLLEAAERGVRVRFLLDDIFTPDVDSYLALMNSHPNVEVRMFNPLTRNSFRYWSLFVDFKRANRRMHNKSLTVDNSFTIVGGRNIAAEYFQIDDEVEFIDFELVGMGPVAREVSATFDQFWNSGLAVPMEAYGEEIEPGALEAWTARLASLEPLGSVYERALDSPLLLGMIDGDVEPFAAEATVVTDRPVKLKTDRGIEEYQELANVLTQHALDAEREVYIITPYFVPRKTGAELLTSLAREGIRVRVVTNSLASTNHVPVHSGYKRYRKRLLEAGVEIYELRSDTVLILDDGQEVGFSATLHTKAIMFDRETLFVGSLNLDPRSIDINTEMGLFLHAPDIATRFAQQVDEDLPRFTYRLVLEDGKLRWRYADDDKSEVSTREPQAGFWRRFTSGVYGILPIEGQL